MVMVKIKISKNCYLGAVVRDVLQVYNLANEGKSVVIAHYGSYSSSKDYYEIKPAAWVISWQARRLQSLINQQTIYFCVKEEDF
jgi:hypothetical protein